ncbi:hypothetical protein VFPPC_17802 [Pochonia chlamydosporia 170]|uniref:Uncharacterized protein n=1 Tax=Pochonia chlamydosporia 170 TaxID=1380566 RepID=A0A219AS24_METCM|nr:hypothetical protein VFPPC_17802 [Pochonia chlamydosporia 170]OWT43005.1 hypothetical protein VFPPC_17802 [Pochonia chlamydosporia 170]
MPTYSTEPNVDGLANGGREISEVDGRIELSRNSAATHPTLDRGILDDGVHFTGFREVVGTPTFSYSGGFVSVQCKSVTPAHAATRLFGRFFGIFHILWHNVVLFFVGRLGLGLLVSGSPTGRVFLIKLPRCSASMLLSVGCVQQQPGCQMCKFAHSTCQRANMLCQAKHRCHFSHSLPGNFTRFTSPSVIWSAQRKR